MIPKLVIIDDDSRLVEYLKDLFKESQEMDLKGFTSGVEGLNYLKNETPKLLLLDLELDDIHGTSICKEARKLHPDLPIIILTGDNSKDMLIRCLNMGADDYVTKPFDNDELIARVNSKIKKEYSEGDQTILKTQDIVLNTDTLEVKRGKTNIVLTGKEFQLLHYLMLNKYRVCTRDKILFSVWGYSAEIDTRVVDVHIAKLRKKLESGNEKKYIQSLRGFGYRIIDD